tara:strand:- start:2126 stop:3541 length:1416 start_codon:yes stop_codon:yes gene_type:complete
MEGYKPTIGLEIHAELKTNTKMFCDSKNDPEERDPNVNVCPVCMAHPGTLPVINKEAVKHVVRVGTALNGNIADFTEFDRKNYFYPDIPKGYQISQYKYPIVSGGKLNGIEITRVHLEEDTARSTHDSHDTHTLVDFNRAGIPLMELVTEPVVGDAQSAGNFARELQLLLRYLGASNANMEKGEMRVEANVSVSKTDEYGTKVEVKNLNSFKVVEKAIEYEIKRQIKELENGGKVVQETRGWDENKQATFSQREKESSHDYRYFPDPDLPKLKLSEIDEFQNIELPELPQEKRSRYQSEFDIKDEDIESYITNPALAGYFENVVGHLKDKDAIKLASNYITSDILGILKTESHEVIQNTIGKLDADDFADLVSMAHTGEISSRGLKEVLPKVLKEDKTARELAEEHGLFQKSDEGELKTIVEKVIADNPKIAEDFRGGNEKVLQFLVGQGMKATYGAGNPQVLAKLFKELI